MTHHPSWLGFSRTAVAQAVAVVAIVASAPALAQNTTASVAGRVLGANGQPAAGITVTIVHIESGSTNNVVTDAEGRFAARGLRPGGPYRISATRGGESERRDDVFLALAETTPLDLRLAAASQTIVVTGRGASEVFSRANMGAGTNIGSRELAAGASIQRNLQDYARSDPRISQTDKERGEISALGQNSRFNKVTIDGVTTNDTFGLESNNLPTLKQPISIDAIQSVQVNISNYDVSQQGYTGANINAITKSGTNDIKGSVYYVWRNQDLAGQRFNRTTGEFIAPPLFKETLKGVTLGGPIVKDKLFFFAAYEELDSTRNSPSFGPIGSAQTNVGITENAITQAQSIATSTWNMNIGKLPGDNLRLNVKDALLKLDWNINDDHRASLRYTQTEQVEPIVTLFTSTALSLDSYVYNQNKNLKSLVGQWFADWSSNFATELKVSKRDYDVLQPALNGTRLPQVVLRFTGATPPGVAGGNRDLFFGTERSRQLNVLETSTVDAYLGANWSLGDHALKFGADYSINDTYNAFLQDVNGQYRFECAPGTYSFGAITNCATATAAQVEAAVLENFRLGRPAFYQVQVPQAGRTLADGIATWKLGSTGLFVQDTWNVSNSLSLMFGVRVDQQNVPSKPLFNAAAAAPRVAGNFAGSVRESGGFGLDNTVTVDGNQLVQPRFGFNWNLPGTQRLQVRGGFGLFQGAAANVWLSNPFSNTGIATGFLSCASFTACTTANAGFSPNPDNQPRLTGTPPAANVDYLDPNLAQPAVWKTNLAVEAELPNWPVVGGLVAGAEWINTRVKDAIYYQHLNLGASTRTGPDGRQLFYRAEGYNPACFDANGNNVATGACATPAGQSRTRALSNPNFANVLLAAQTKKGGGDAVTLSLRQPTRDGFSWSAAYTRTTATEVSGLTSSVSNSNWAARSVFNPNEEADTNSAYLIKDRVNASVTWTKAFIPNYRTSLGMFFEWRKGKPYSWTYINDLNGDGLAGNDLMYVPTAPGSGDVVFRNGAAEEARFWEIVNENKALRSARGSVVKRNTEYAPHATQLDMRVSQELPGFTSKHKASVTLDILNVTNLLNRNWGRIDEFGFNANGGVRRSFVNYNGIDPSGRYIYSLGTVTDYTTRQVRGESQWAANITLRYEF